MHARNVLMAAQTLVPVARMASKIGGVYGVGIDVFVDGGDESLEGLLVLRDAMCDEHATKLEISRQVVGSKTTPVFQIPLDDGVTGLTFYGPEFDHHDVEPGSPADRVLQAIVEAEKAASATKG